MNQLLQQQEHQEQLVLFDRTQLSEQAQTQLETLESELSFQFRRDAKNVFQIGNILYNIRVLIQEDLKAQGIPKNSRHNGFKAWCEEHGLTRQSVYRYISVYDALKTCHNLLHAHDIPASVLYLLAKPTTPQAVRQDFVTRWERGESITVQDVKDALAEAKGAKRRWTPLEFVSKIDQALDWWQKEKIRLQEHYDLTDESIYPDRKASYQKKIDYATGRIGGLEFTQKLFACVQKGATPLLICGDFPTEFCIEIDEIAERWGQFDEFAIEI